MSQDNLPPIQRIAELQQMIADFSEVKRMVKIADKDRLENDVEHSFGLALTCWFIAEKIAPELNMEKILKYALAHDIVELHAGDTFVFDQKSVKNKSDREDNALEKLAKDWPDFAELTQFAKKYKNHHDPEAVFVYTVDKMLPSILVNLGEKDVFWNHHKVTRHMYEQEKIKKMTNDSKASAYLKLLNDWLADPDYFYKGDAS